MNLTALKGLVYREFFLARKNLFTNSLLFILVSVLCCLIQLSMKTGNLSLLIKNNDDFLKDMIIIMINFYPILSGGFISDGITVSALRESNLLWLRFCHSTPVNHWKFALAKYASILLLFFAELILCSVYMSIICYISDTKFTYSHIVFIISIICLITLFNIGMQVFTMLFHSMDKGGLAMVFILFSIICVPMTKTIYSENSEIPMFTFEALQERFINMFPALIIIFVVLFICGFIATAMLYKRRER